MKLIAMLLLVKMYILNSQYTFNTFNLALNDDSFGDNRLIINYFSNRMELGKSTKGKGKTVRV